MRRRTCVVVALLVSAAAPAAAQPSSAELGGYLQVDLVPWHQRSVDQLDPTTGDPLNQTRALIRRGRVRATAHRGPATGLIELDGNTLDGAAARLVSAWIAYGLVPECHGGAERLALRAGLFKIPFGREVPQYEAGRFFLEPATFARALFPGSYDAGVALGGQWRWLRYDVAAMNGAPSGDAQFGGRDPAEGVELVGRGGVEVEAGGGVVVRAGLSALVGRGLHPGTTATKDELVWVDANEDGLVQNTELQIQPGSPADPSETFDHDALGADAEVRWVVAPLGPGAAFAEIAIAKNLDRGVWPADPVAVNRDVRELGWVVGAYQALPYGGEVGVRYDRYLADRDGREVRGVDVVAARARFDTLAVALGWRRDRVRALAVYEHERNPLGRGDDGAPTTLASDRVTARAQLEF